MLATGPRGRAGGVGFMWKLGEAKGLVWLAGRSTNRGAGVPYRHRHRHRFPRSLVWLSCPVRASLCRLLPLDAELGYSTYSRNLPTHPPPTETFHESVRNRTHRPTVLPTTTRNATRTAAMADKVFTYSDVAEHNTKKDLYMVVHDKVYDATSFVDEHP